MTASEQAENPRAVLGDNSATVTDILRDTQADLIKMVDAIRAEENGARDAMSKATPEGEKIIIRTDEQRDVVLGIGVKSGKLATTIDNTRLATTKPDREKVEEINKFFNVLKDHADKIKSIFGDLIGDYDRLKRDQARRAAAIASQLADEEAARKLAEATASQNSVESDVVMNEAIEADNRARKLQAAATTAGTGPTRTEAGTVSSTKSWTHTVVDWPQVNLTEFRDSFTPDEIEKAIRKHVKSHKNTKPLTGVRIFQDEKTSLRG